MKKTALISVIIISLFFISVKLSAQFSGGGGTPGGGGGGGSIPGSGGGPEVPFDGGMSFMLLVSGIGYGVRKLRKK